MFLILLVHCQFFLPFPQPMLKCAVKWSVCDSAILF
eukprot:XP_001709634.1 Hypothetical protein GL50803_35267 [Giardia lamblia ATCC 50803]